MGSDGEEPGCSCAPSCDEGHLTARRQFAHSVMQRDLETYRFVLAVCLHCSDDLGNGVSVEQGSLDYP